MGKALGRVAQWRYPMREELEGQGHVVGHEPRYPRTVLAAGMLWVAFGGLCLLFALVSFVTMGCMGGRLNVAQLGGQLLGCLALGLFGRVFTTMGVRSNRGTVRGMRFYAYLSALVGIPSFLFLPALFGLAAMEEPPATTLAAMAFGFILAASLVAASALALVGRRGHMAWREAHRLKPQPGQGSVGQ
ncbi:MAG: hypothetical protein FJ279_12645 [Planctomycetes bacterium]|nr:hypothetical protein [Planctomycetota bacterium]